MQYYWLNNYLNKGQEYWLKAKERWLQLAPREKKAVAIGSVAVSIFVLYVAIWSPILNHNNELRQRIQINTATLTWMQNADKEIQKANNESKSQMTALSPVMLLSFLQKEITLAGLSSSLTQLKQSSNESISIQFQKVEFDKLIKLLIDVSKKENVTITQMSTIASTSPGIVDVNLVMKI